MASSAPRAASSLPGEEGAQASLTAQWEALGWPTGLLTPQNRDFWLYAFKKQREMQDKLEALFQPSQEWLEDVLETATGLFYPAKTTNRGKSKKASVVSTKRRSSSLMVGNLPKRGRISSIKSSVPEEEALEEEVEEATEPDNDNDKENEDNGNEWENLDETNPVLLPRTPARKQDKNKKKLEPEAEIPKAVIEEEAEPAPQKPPRASIRQSKRISRAVSQKEEPMLRPRASRLISKSEQISSPSQNEAIVSPKVRRSVRNGRTAAAAAKSNIAKNMEELSNLGKKKRRPTEKSHRSTVLDKEIEARKEQLEIQRQLEAKLRKEEEEEEQRQRQEAEQHQKELEKRQKEEEERKRREEEEKARKQKEAEEKRRQELLAEEARQKLAEQKRIEAEEKRQKEKEEKELAERRRKEQEEEERLRKEKEEKEAEERLRKEKVEKEAEERLRKEEEEQAKLKEVEEEPQEDPEPEPEPEPMVVDDDYETAEDTTEEAEDKEEEEEVEEHDSTSTTKPLPKPVISEKQPVRIKRVPKPKELTSMSRSQEKANLRKMPFSTSHLHTYSSEKKRLPSTLSGSHILSSERALKTRAPLSKFLGSAEKVKVNGLISSAFSFLPSAVKDKKPTAEEIRKRKEEKIKEKELMKEEQLREKEELRKRQIEEKKAERVEKMRRAEESRKQQEEALKKKATEKVVKAEQARLDKLAEIQKFKENQAKRLDQEQKRREALEERRKCLEEEEKQRRLQLAEEKKEEEARLRKAESHHKPVQVKSSSNPDSYDMTPARHELPPEPLENPNNYDINDLRSDDDTDDEDQPRKILPSWASGHAFRTALLTQCYNPPDVDHIFDMIDLPDLSTIFKEQRKRFFKRTSSAQWGKMPTSYKFAS
eukprot:TCALIF_07903-PA protein Name:"Similar to INCENP Inner centromere protein (Gallus gallus)" AED:0.07 eAED:0.07 QI:151/0.6/0.5/0.66/1/1/6/0/880